MVRTRALPPLAALAFIAACAAWVRSGDIRMSANLDGKKEVPAVDTPATATATVIYDRETRAVTWDIYYSGLEGRPTAAHFHGPALPGNVAGIQVDLAPNGFPDPTDPLRGSALIADEQAAALLAGKWYVNIHTDAYPEGEIRGQVVRQP
jgi:hypothetical protein